MSLLRRRMMMLAGIGDDEDMKITPYFVAENADRSLWLNEQGIKLVKGINLIVSDKWLYNESSQTYAQGAISEMLLLWDGVETTVGTNPSTMSQTSHLRAWQMPQGAYSNFGTSTALTVGNTTKTAVAADGTLSFTTSATEVTTGNYNNSYFEGGHTYYLVQIPNDTVC